MDIYKKILFVIIGLCSIFATCKKNECIGNSYLFKMQAEFSPPDSVLSIGDTLFYTLIHSTNFLNDGTQDSIDFSNSNNMSSTLQFIELFGLPEIARPSVNNFEIISIQGLAYTDPSINPTKVKQLKFIKSIGFYILKIGIKCLIAGTYYMGTDNIQNVNRTNNNNCTDRADIIVEISNIDHHLQYYQDILPPGSIISDYEKKHGYCFRVR